MERGLYLKQVGAAAALLQIQLWIALSVAVLLWWLVAAGESVSWRAIAGMLAFSALSQVWLFAAATWLARCGTKVFMLIGMIAAVTIGCMMPIVTSGFTAAPWSTVQPHVVCTVAGLLTAFSLFAIWAAYRRWLVTDFG